MRFTELAGLSSSGWSFDPRFPDPFPPPFASAWGDDLSGLWADFEVSADGGEPVTQRMRWIPPGRFTMGSPADEQGRWEVEGPQHEVVLAEGYWLFDTPCTQALWRAVMGENPSRFQNPWEPDRPVENVSFGEVQAFLEKANALPLGLDLCLPSEAQWEYACRAGTETATYVGAIEILGNHNAPGLDAIAWYGGNSGVGPEVENAWDSSGWPEQQYPHTRAATHPVKRKRANPWGLYDMLGNVWEWCADHWHGSYEGAPADGSAWNDREAAADRVVRGGSCNGGARFVRAAYRYVWPPEVRFVSIGFRCARVQVSGSE